MSQGDYGWVPDDNETPSDATAQAPAELWPEGNYEGKYVRHTTGASASKGTPGISVVFAVNGKEITVDCWITEATLAGMTGDQLASLGWNGEYPGAEFEPPDTVHLWMKYDTYKNKTRERWNISTAKKEATPAVLQLTSRACAVWKAKRTAPAPAPTSAPKPPPKAPAAPTPNGTKPAAPKAPAKPKPKTGVNAAATTMDEAWRVWQATPGAEKPDELATAFYAEMERIAGHADGAKLTADECQKLAAAAPPF